MKCKDKVKSSFKNIMKNIESLYNTNSPDLYDYGLSVDLVKAGTFKGQKKPYYRYQLSWGGPTEEFRIYPNGDIEFWFLDWYDGASIKVTDPNDKNIIMNTIIKIIKRKELK